MQEISEPEYKNLTSLEELEKMKGLPLATSGNAASISSLHDDGILRLEHTHLSHLS